MSVLCRRQLPFIGPGQRLTPLNPMVIRRSKPAKCTYCCQGLNKNEVMRSRVEVRRALEKIAVRRIPLVSIKCAMTAGTALAAAATSGYLHAAVTSTITNVAITAVAIASGACLSTKIDCLWPRGEQGPESVELDGVDVTGYTIFSESKVQKAATFARKAHSGQTRKTGEPYLTHCIHTGKILAALVPSSGQRAINTVVAGILHDVIDDTGENLQTVEQNFGDDVASLVAGVSKLSYINQLLRRHRRTNALENGDLALAEMDNLRVMLLGMVDDPRVVLIKLADRLHNMRTIYALPPSKAQAVAQETLAVWCSLASRLGLWAIKSELEDLCFAVLQPQVFRNLHAELAAMWTPSREQRYLRRIMESARHRRSLHGSKDDFNLVKKDDFHTDDGERIKELIQGVQPFELLLDRGKRSHILSNFAKNTTAESMKPKIVHDAEIAIASLTACEEAIEKELVLSTSYIPGMEVTLSGRLKSLYSTYCKMKRKQVSIDHIYDARALRVIVGDGGGKMHAAAVECCYSLLNVIHSLWTPLDGEFDDYIVNPKPSGYQSLHTAVKGPDGSPLEVQVRTQCMHESAEYGHAAHWLYKEARNIGRCISFPDDGNNIILPNGNDIIGSTSQETQKDADKELYPTVNSIRAGHPVLRIEDSRLLVAVVVRVNDGGKELLVAVSFALAASEAVAAGRLSNQTKRWEAYAKLYKKVSEKWWFAPGHGDWNTFIEKYVLCRDGIYHKQDQFQRSLPTFIQLIDLSMEENEEYWEVMSTVLEGKEIDGGSSSSSCSTNSTSVTPVSAISTTTHLNNKIRLLRSMLEWEQQLRNEVVFGTASASSPTVPKSAVLTEVAIIRWPDGDIMRMKFGSTAADAARRLGMDGRFVFVNGQVALPHTQLKDGDVVEVRT